MKFFNKYILITAIFFSPAGFAENMFSGVEAEFGVELPVYFGANIKTSINRNLYARFGAGVTNEFFLSGLHWYSPKLGKINRAQTSLVAGSLVNNPYVDVRLGYRKNRFQGLFAELGWSFMAGGREEMKTKDLKPAIQRSSLNEDVESLYKLESNIHNVTGHAGYTFSLSKKMGLSVELGVIKPIYADVNVDYGNIAFAGIDKAKAQKEDAEKIQKIFEKKVWIITGSLWVSYAL